MDKIKTVKIKNSDGSISEESYTISVDARNVDMDNGKELQETIGTINIDTDGNIAEQLENLNDNTDELNIDIKKKVYFFNTVADMKNANLKVGDYACTLGYYEANDGGAGDYQIISGNYIDDGGSYHKLDNNLYAKLIIKDKIDVKQFGAYGDNSHDDAIAIQNAINYGQINIKNVYIPNGIYRLTDSIKITTSHFKLIGENVEKTVLQQTGANKHVLIIEGTDITNINYINISEITCRGDFAYHEIGEGTVTTAAGLFINYASSIRLNRVNLQYNANGILFGHKSWANAFIDCIISGNKYAGIDSSEIIDGSTPSEAIAYRTASTLYFYNCFIHHNVDAFHWQGSVLNIYGGWIAENNNVIHIYDVSVNGAEVPSGNISIYGTDIEGNKEYVFLLDGRVGGVYLNTNYIMHANETLIKITKNTVFGAFDFNCIYNMRYFLNNDTAPYARLYLKTSQELIPEYFENYISKSSIRLGSGSTFISRNIIMDDILNLPNGTIINNNGYTLPLQASEKIAFKIQNCSVISKLSFKCNSNVNLPTLYYKDNYIDNNVYSKQITSAMYNESTQQYELNLPTNIFCFGNETNNDIIISNMTIEYRN